MMRRRYKENLRRSLLVLACATACSCVSPKKPAIGHPPVVSVHPLTDKMEIPLEIKELLRKLNHHSPEARAAAALELGRARYGRALPRITRLLDDADPKVQEAATQALGMLGHLESVKHLSKMLKHPDLSVRRASVLGLANIIGNLHGDSSSKHKPVLHAIRLLQETAKKDADKDNRKLAKLLLDLNHADVSMREIAAKELGKFSDTLLAWVLVKKLYDSNVHVRVSIIHILGEIGDTKAVLPLINRLDGTSKERDAAIEALGKIGDKRATIHLLRLLKEQDDAVRIRAIAALGSLKDKKAAEALIDHLNSLADPASADGPAAVEALGKIGDEKALVPLMRLLENPKDKFRIIVINALGELRSEKAIPALIAAWKNNDWFVVEAALVKTGPPAVPMLLDKLESGNDDEKAFSAMVLGALSDRRAVDPLIDTLNTNKTNPDIRALAAEALGRIGDPKAVPHLLAVMQESIPNAQQAFNSSSILSRFGAFYNITMFGTPQHTAADSLARIGGEQVVDGLLKILKDRSGSLGIRYLAAFALGKTGDETALDALRSILTSKDPLAPFMGAIIYMDEWEKRRP